MLLRNRTYQKELLDGDQIPFADIKKNMEELNSINTLLGGHAITVKGFAALAGAVKKITVCEIGCGGGDNLVAIAKWCKKQDIQLTCIGIDIKEECIAVARAQQLLKDNASWIVSDYAEVAFTNQPDIIFSSLFCHHFTNEELVKQLGWMHRSAKTGFFINDLQRNIVAFHAIRFLTALFSSSYLVKNDAPLSVARGFHKNEWIAICDEAGIHGISVQWQWAFRYLIIYRHAG